LKNFADYLKEKVNNPKNINEEDKKRLKEEYHQAQT